MTGTSQGTSYPGSDARLIGPRSAACRGSVANNTGGARRSSPRAAEAAPRPRIRFADARRIHREVLTKAAELRLRGCRAHVLDAALWLLCGHSRLFDDRVRIHQIHWRIVEICDAHYDPKTIGRALRQLHDAGLLTYRPACGRGTAATISIPEMFATGAEILRRDTSGRVMTATSSEAETVTFSSPRHLSIGISKNPLTPKPQRHHTPPSPSRPVKVAVNPQEVRYVRAHMLTAYRQLPSPRLNALMTSTVYKQLARGWAPEQILQILNAPLPAGTQAPWRLATWRLSMNQPGAGPRLSPLQREWDGQKAHDDHQQWRDTVCREYNAAKEVFGAQAISTVEAALSRRGSIRDLKAAVVHAGRMARRSRPTARPAEALLAWLGTQPEENPEPEQAAGKIDIPSVGCCVSCGSAEAVFRRELPLPELAMVCDECWRSHADAELQEQVA